MERTFWPAWEKFLSRYGLIPFVRDLLSDAPSLIHLISQVIILGAPFCNGFTWGREYKLLVETLGDRKKLDAFADYLMEDLR